MTLETLQEQWRQLQNRQGSLQEASALAKRAAQAFMARYFAGEPPDFRAIELLGSMAVHDDPEVVRAGTAALYATVIEGLCDDFTERGVQVCNRVLLHGMQVVRGLPSGRELDDLLTKLGFASGDALLARYDKLGGPRLLAPDRFRAVTKILVLSRVTAGADIAITSVLVQGLRQAFPAAELVLIGPPHLEEFFAGVPRVRCRQLPYNRKGSLLERVAAWGPVHRLMQEEVGSLPPESYLLCDPDTRLSQLGLLPLAPAASTWYFNSRTDRGTPEKAPLSQLASRWLGDLLGARLEISPAVFVAENHKKAARSFIGKVRNRGGSRVLVLNLGVGHNPEKRVPGDFEGKLLRVLIEEKETALVLDCGSGGQEEQRVRSLLADLERQAISTAFVEQGELEAHPSLDAMAIGFRGSLGALGGLLLEADGFIGYDSCGQHLAAALGTPTVVVFAGAPNDRFRARWSAAGPSATILPVEDGSRLGPQAESRLLERVAAAARHAFRREEIGR